MKRILTIICAIAFSGAALSAQNNADTIRVSKNDGNDLVIIVKEQQPIERQAQKERRLTAKAQRPAYMVNVGYNRGYRADIELSWADISRLTCKVWGGEQKKDSKNAVLTKSGKRGSNSRPQPWQGCALPTELFPHNFKKTLQHRYLTKVVYLIFFRQGCALPTELFPH